MFIGSTLTNGLDRLTARSVSSGATGSLFGVIGSAILIILCFVIFIGPIFFYFQGDYVQSSFSSRDAIKNLEYTGCDFKMAISFYSKTTGRPINHKHLNKILDSHISYWSANGSSFTFGVNPCDPDYFEGMEDPPQDFREGNCFIAPDKLGYYSEIIGRYSSFFGFEFLPICSNPFLCVYNSEAL